MITKEKLRSYINDMPDEISIDELIDRLVFIEKLENRISESDKENVLDESEIKSEMMKWYTMEQGT
ncbi:hypothetical protein [Flavobacterium psychrotrophum]|uniref:hypothetical protein n=1 Tax=Flavobacterium psychrotrophum TaxID=2294119 RepID=UPI000E31AD34|nr:hypothetical protein [Flavobacterium psychrotrophum]